MAHAWPLHIPSSRSAPPAAALKCVSVFANQGHVWYGIHVIILQFTLASCAAVWIIAPIAIQNVSIVGLCPLDAAYLCTPPGRCSRMPPGLGGGPWPVTGSPDLNQCPSRLFKSQSVLDVWGPGGRAGLSGSAVTRGGTSRAWPLRTRSSARTTGPVGDSVLGSFAFL